MGTVSGIASRDEMTGWGYALSGFAAVGLKGMSGQYFSNFSGGYNGATIGYAAGLGASLGLMLSRTRFDQAFSFANAPEPIRSLISGCSSAG